MVFAGAHYAMGQSGGPPQIPLDLVREYGGAGTHLVAGVLAALLEAF
jgi:alpha-methylacyl-CoA racemase